MTANSEAKSETGSETKSEVASETGSETKSEVASETGSETKWLTTGEAAQMLGVSVSTVRRLADTGQLVAERRRTWSLLPQDSLGRRLNGHRRVSEASVRKLLSEAEADGGRGAQTP